ncbi:MAG: L-threonylcarbamoyladenylate synthase [Holophagae bacterium]|jgi:tRNA threonylcarbamoyl adenosine modification protein (Sua5/YciO/YrdC/YwlC family)
MKRFLFVADSEVKAALDPVAETVSGGGIVLLPTESFYGLGADPSSHEAADRICSLKGRPTEMGLPVLAADWQQVDRLARVPGRFRAKLARLWPAPVTVVVETAVDLPAARMGTLAIRIPNHAPLRALLYRTGPLTGTSANCHGDPPCVTVGAALASLAAEPDVVLDGGTTAGGEPSTLVDLTGPDALILRAGAGRWEDAESIFE